MQIRCPKFVEKKEHSKICAKKKKKHILLVHKKIPEHLCNLECHCLSNK